MQGNIVQVNMFNAMGVVRCHQSWREEYKGPMETRKEDLPTDTWLTPLLPFLSTPLLFF